jgi:predicted transcriptional regulator
MKILEAMKDHNSGPSGGGASDGDAAGLPIIRYDRLDAWEASAKLATLSQVELATVQAYEDDHGARPEVLGKLRYLRGDEPLPGYDTLEPEEIATALREATPQTIVNVREYERKFQRRSEVLEDLARARSENAGSIVG